MKILGVIGARRARVAMQAVLLWACSGVEARADGVVVAADAMLATPVSKPQIDLFGLGGSASVAAFRPLNRLLLAGLRARVLFLSDGGATFSDPSANDPEVGGLAGLSANLRLRPFGARGDKRRSPGLSIEIAAGAALTGSVVRPTLEAGIGWGFDLGAVTLGPTLRYVQVIQPHGGLDPRDARLALGGFEVILFDGENPPPAPEPPRPSPPSDRDGDGVTDNEDMCPDEAEDMDGFEDTDGCPDADNDADGIVDAEDACPMEPEDHDDWEDGDGCPDPDNDADGVADADDRCPTEAEVVNGIEDEDGCPDQGEIIFIEGRVTLEEEVLFDVRRARVRHAAWPMLRAIVRLWSQHPEWVGLRLEGHSDIRGPADYNQTLSERRARNVLQMLVRFGMSADMIRFEGLGELNPVAEGRNEAAHRRNRRVVFIAITRQPNGRTGEVQVLDSSEATDGAP